MGTSETVAALTLYGSLQRKQSFPQTDATSGFGQFQTFRIVYIIESH